jgi:hypothetical protein
MTEIAAGKSPYRKQSGPREYIEWQGLFTPTIQD